MTKSLKPCPRPGCPTLTPGGPCAVHAPKPWHHAQPVARVRGRRLQRLRDELFQRHPLCVLCLAAGRRTVATIRDHVVPLTEDGPDDQTNEQAICATCHEVKTTAEAARGRARASHT